MPNNAKRRESRESSFLDQTELLRRLRISRPTLLHWRQQGTIPSIKLGRRVLFHWDSVEKALLRNQREVAA